MHSTVNSKVYTAVPRVIAALNGNIFILHIFVYLSLCIFYSHTQSFFFSFRYDTNPQPNKKP